MCIGRYRTTRQLFAVVRTESPVAPEVNGAVQGPNEPTVIMCSCFSISSPNGCENVRTLLGASFRGSFEADFRAQAEHATRRMSSKAETKAA